MLPGQIRRLGAHGFYVQANYLSVCSIVVANEHFHCIERPPDIHAAECLVLVIFQPVLVIEMDAPQFLVPEGVCHFIRWIETEENAMGRFDEDAGPRWIACEIAHGKHMARGW